MPDGGRVVAGTYLPAKVLLPPRVAQTLILADKEEQTTVGMSAVPVHLDCTAFGADAAQYNPSRWIDGTTAPDGSSLSPEEMQRWWIPFGQGSRQCIGKNVAMLEVCNFVVNPFLPLLTPRKSRADMTA